MYLVGGGTHPGAGIPGVLMGAAITAGLVATDYRGLVGIRPHGGHAPLRRLAWR